MRGPVQHPITSFKTRDVAEKLAATILPDSGLVAAVIERKDGRFVVELRDIEDGAFIGCL